MAMSRTRTKKVLLILSVLLALMVTSPVLVPEAAYWTGLLIRGTVPRPDNSEIESTVSRAIWIGFNESLPITIEPHKRGDPVWHLYFPANANEEIPVMPRGHLAAVACSRYRLRDAGLTSTGYVRRVAGISDMIWLSRNATADQVIGCIYQNADFPCEIRGYADASIKLLGKGIRQLSQNEAISLTAMAYYGGVTGDSLRPIRERSNVVIDSYAKNGELTAEEAESLKTTPLPEIRTCAEVKELARKQPADPSSIKTATGDTPDQK